jgi:hypothetical protein
VRLRRDDGNTRGVRSFKPVQTSRRIIALRHIFLYCLRQLSCGCRSSLGYPSPPFISNGHELQRKSSSQLFPNYKI